MPLRAFRRNTLRMYTAAPHNAVVSTDAAGMLELWDPITLALPHSVTFKFKSDTGLYDLAKAKTTGKSIEVRHRHDVVSPPRSTPPNRHAGVPYRRRVQRGYRFQKNSCLSHRHGPPVR
jgi:hypothetical protein